MAELWLAKQEGPGGFEKQVALKKILPHLAADPAFVQMFLAEARLAARLDHPNIVKVFELGEEAGDYFLVMEYLRGASLRELFDRGGPFDFALTARLAVGVCDGLHHAHELTRDGALLGLVHRDLSPENVLVGFDGLPRLLDFGIARAISAVSVTVPGIKKGKLEYMAPEQLSGAPLDRRADLFSLGVLLYEALAGRRPFGLDRRGQSAELRLVRPDAPLAFQSLVSSLLQLDPRQRPPDALSVRRELEGYLRVHPFESSGVAEWIARVRPADVAPSRGSSRATAQLVERSAQTVAPEAEAARTELNSLLPTDPVIRRPPIRWLAAASGLAVAMAIGSAFGLASSRPTPAVPEASGSDPSGVPVVTVSALEVRASEPESDLSPERRPARVEPGRIARHPPRPEPVSEPAKATPGGVISVRVHPWGDVVVDGQAVGSTPLGPLPMAVGRHTVSVANLELHQTRTVTVEVRAGRESLVEVRFKE